MPPREGHPIKAIILAAGRGQRMRPLTDHTPKVLLAVRGKPLIEWHLLALARAGVKDIVVNTAWLEEQIAAALGDGTRWGVRLHYSMEGRDHGGALETAGGIAQALPLLADHPEEVFWAVSGDIHAQGFDFGVDVPARMARNDVQAHLWLVPNPAYHAQGDFGLDPQGYALAERAAPEGRTWTYANLGLFRASFFNGVARGRVRPLGPLLFDGMRRRAITGEVYCGDWENVGTQSQLQMLNRAL